MIKNGREWRELKDCTPCMWNLNLKKEKVKKAFKVKLKAWNAYVANPENKVWAGKSYEKASDEFVYCVNILVNTYKEYKVKNHA